ncbi:hypothetical protein F2Q70_00001722 [Brassica cretica]|uniref:Ubiquitin-like protease family profile domain-containing protein n=1 Tax=Brassica cretica TaxID=69181 RepID=A0A8S9IZW6_BRACR|nr:hypothetical protein F2Q70_00001722 [Brassica cretica]
MFKTTVSWHSPTGFVFNFKDFKDSKPDQNGLGRRLLGGAWNYYAGTIPSFCQSNKVWGRDIDDIYAPVNYTDTHWIAMWIFIPKRHIIVFDNICSSISLKEFDVVMEHFLYMVPYLLVECASSNEQRAQYSLEPFTYERPTNIPQARAGDCGVYALKYIECHALGIDFSKKDFAKPNGKTMRIRWQWIYFKSILTRISSKTRTMMPTWFPCILSIYKPCVASGVCVLSSWIASTKIAILISSVFPDHALNPEESMCVPQLVVHHKDIYSLSILQTGNPLSTLDIQVWRYANQQMFQQL